MASTSTASSPSATWCGHSPPTAPSALGRTVQSVMSAEVVTCAAGDSVEQLMASMTERRFRHLPVVDGDVLAGIISIGDVVKARLGQLENENQALTEYIHQGR